MLLDPPRDSGTIHYTVHSSSSSSSMTSSGSSCGRCSSFSPRPSSSSAVGTPPPTILAPAPPLAATAAAAPPSPTDPCPSPDGRRLLSLPSRKPHRSSDPAWAAIRSLGADVGPRHFKLVRRLGSGDIGTVYLCRLRDDEQHYAMKVVDKRELARKKKLGRAEAERRVLGALDHPFLPTLYADFDAPPHFSCAVMEFCSGGDLHTLRHRQPSRCFPIHAVRFYAAEVLMALEYLHMLGVVYRDLKPENVLIRSDGHIMLSDFDLSLQSTASPAVRFSPDHYLNAADASPPSPTASSSLDNDDYGGNLQRQARRPSCLPGRLIRFLIKSPWRKKAKGGGSTAAVGQLSRSRSTRSCCSSAGAGGSWVFVAEPVEARSSSFVGTHEYVAPEVASGGRHGAAVDWWAYGVFLYELAYGRTPFAGDTNAATLRNIVCSPLAFPQPPQTPPQQQQQACDPRLRDLISGLLEKDPGQRLGSSLGAAEVKAHPFFEGLNFALLRSQRPPMVPGCSASRSVPRSKSCREQQQLQLRRRRPNASYYYPARSSFDLWF